MEKIKRFEPLFGEWYVESFIGAGSFGRVYKIYREELGHRFYSALKYISIPADDSELVQLKADGMDSESISDYYTDIARNFASEIAVMDRLSGNTNIVNFEGSRVIPKPDGVGYDVFIRMELLESLTFRMANTTFSEEDVVRIGIDICSALIRCGKAGIIHRDIKPDNIFVSKDGDYKLGDFGIARQLEKTATFMSKKGTYNYMAPEVYKGEKYGASCDTYSLGLVMYRLLNRGRLPFLPPAPEKIFGDDREKALIARFRGDTIPAPCDASARLASIVLKACAYRQEDRYASAEDMWKDLFYYRQARLNIAAQKEAQGSASQKAEVKVASRPRADEDADSTQSVARLPQQPDKPNVSRMQQPQPTQQNRYVPPVQPQPAQQNRYVPPVQPQPAQQNGYAAAQQKPQPAQQNGYAAAQQKPQPPQNQRTAQPPQDQLSRKEQFPKPTSKINTSGKPREKEKPSIKKIALSVFGAIMGIIVVVCLFNISSPAAGVVMLISFLLLLIMFIIGVF